jgi:hypothetical protein
MSENENMTMKILSMLYSLLSVATSVRACTTVPADCLSRCHDGCTRCIFLKNEVEAKAFSMGIPRAWRRGFANASYPLVNIGPLS